jgi:hypothetical protein
MCGIITQEEWKYFCIAKTMCILVSIEIQRTVRLQQEIKMWNFTTSPHVIFVAKHELNADCQLWDECVSSCCVIKVWTGYKHVLTPDKNHGMQSIRLIIKQALLAEALKPGSRSLIRSLRSPPDTKWFGLTTLGSRFESGSKRAYVPLFFVLLWR